MFHFQHFLNKINGFEMTINTPSSFTLPLHNGVTNAIVYWGDGNSDVITAYNQSELTHVYSSGGNYNIVIDGNFEGIHFNNSGDKDKLVSIEQWGNNVWGTFASSFYGCYNFIGGTATDTPNLSMVTDMNSAFRNCPNFNMDISGFNTSAVTVMDFTFVNCQVFNHNIGLWDMSSVIGMNAMMFNCKVFNQDVGNWDLSNSENIFQMFQGCTAFNNGGNPMVWNLPKITSLSNLFASCTSFNQQISGWTIPLVTNMSNMIQLASSFDQDLALLDISGVTSMSNMLLGVTLTTSNYNSTLIGWEGQPHQTGVYFHGGNSVYSLPPAAGGVARGVLVTSDSWIITDGGGV